MLALSSQTSQNRSKNDKTCTTGFKQGIIMLFQKIQRQIQTATYLHTYILIYMLKQSDTF